MRFEAGLAVFTFVVLFTFADLAVNSAWADRSAGGQIDMSARGGAELESESGDRVYATSGHADVRALYGKRFALAADFGFEVGAEVPGGFVYGARLLPVGGAIRFGGRGWVGVTAGFGGSGVVDRVPISLELPVNAFLAFDLGSYVRFSSRLRTTWLPTSDRRGDGSRSLEFADEIDFEAGFAFGKRDTNFRSHFSDGNYVGVFVREQLSSRIVGISIAIAMSGAGSF